ncbi:MAG: S1 RNA-binding domain-containing protein, partial [Alphaproteobacteria bacterium]|nr:S1 RNA-binding domain-containing protein [Alphaproteobacteria bacterium]
MGSKMLIDATHSEETRVVVVRGNRIEEFDFESAARRQLKGNIYLAKVTRVEPSLQAAFVEYGGNRHGFLAFAEIHPDYYQIPLADRQALLREQEEDDAEQDDDDNGHSDGGEERHRERPVARPLQRDQADNAISEAVADESGEADDEQVESPAEPSPATSEETSEDTAQEAVDTLTASPDVETVADDATDTTGEELVGTRDADGDGPEVAHGMPAELGNGLEVVDEDPENQKIESIGAEDALEEVPQRRRKPPRRQYKIQEVIKRRQ